MINIALKYIDQNERIILKDSDSAVIAYLGSTENAMFIESDMRDEILKINTNFSTNLNLGIGIHLENVKAEKNIDGQSNIFSIGINEAKRIMNYTEPNETLVSRSFFENAPESTQKFLKMFDDSIDKIVDYELNRQASFVIPSKNNTITGPQISISAGNLSSLNYSAFLNSINLKYALTTLLILIMVFLLIRLNTFPNQSTIPIQKVLKVDPEKVAINLPIAFKQTKYDEKTQENLKQKELVITKQLKNKTKIKKYKSKDSNLKINKAKESSVWKLLIANIKHGQKNKCTQSEIALRHCN